MPIKQELKRALSGYIRVTGYRVVPPKNWLPVFRTIKDGLPADCARRVVQAADQQVMVVMCWEPSLSDFLVHIVTSDGKVHVLPPP